MGGNAQAAQPRKATRQEIVVEVKTTIAVIPSDVCIAHSLSVFLGDCILCDNIDEPCGGTGKSRLTPSCSLQLRVPDFEARSMLAVTEPETDGAQSLLKQGLWHTRTTSQEMNSTIENT
jgi:hypothetical protein